MEKRNKKKKKEKRYSESINKDFKDFEEIKEIFLRIPCFLNFLIGKFKITIVFIPVD
jgi:hypothetical protein